MKRYRPVLNNRKEVIMSEDESGDWTSLSCYYTLHDRVVRAEGKIAALAVENERLKERVAFLERADKLMTYDHKAGGWRWHFNEPVTKDTFLPPK